MSYSFGGFSSKQWGRCRQADTFERRIIRLERIEALLAIAAAILVFLGIFGSFRRRCSNRAFALVAFAAYYLSPAIIAYTLGLIQSAPFCSSHFPVWAAYLVVVLGSADSYTAHSFGDIEQWKSFNLDSAAKCFMTSWMIATYVTPSVPIFCTVFLFVILFVKVDERARALMSASNSVMQKKYKLIADYMSTEHIDSGDCDPSQMRGYKYLVRFPEDTKVRSLFSIPMCRGKAATWKDGRAPHYRQSLKITDEHVTVEKVWHCQGALLRGGRGEPLRDLCLSFSLFKFICMRFAGHTLPQEAHQKLRRLILHMLLETDGYRRVFRIIEVELAFLFDLFYTKYSVNLNPRHSVYKLIQLAIVVAAALISLLLVPWHSAMPHDHESHYLKFPGVFITILFMTSIFIVEFAQFGIMIFSEWAKVKYICKYVQSEWWRNFYGEKLIEIMCRVQLLKPWGGQLHQYSLLESYGYSPCKWIYNRFTAAYLDPKRNGQKQSASINLPKQVMERVAVCLTENCPDNSVERPPSLSLRSLRLWSLRLGTESEGLSLDFETATHVILVWHIATTFWEHKWKRSPSQEQRDNIATATALSKYLAYLVAFVPEMIPGHPCRTGYIFDCAVREAEELFVGSSVSMDDRINKLEVIGKDQSRETIVARGAQLGMSLVNALADKDPGKVLADFWANMMLYVATSNDMAAHAKYLTTGGEFVTHVWVLVSHAGITRDPHDGEQHDDLERS